MTGEDSRKKKIKSGLPTPPKSSGAATSKKESRKVMVAVKGASTQKSQQIKKLGQELSKQKGIFQKHAGRAINPDGSDAYWAAKGKFDAADRKIKEIEKEIAHLLTGGD
ncbi:MAG: hypothetical protein ACTSQZ_05645 [Candidatus Thorarchaeota archaeon]